MVPLEMLFRFTSRVFPEPVLSLGAGHFTIAANVGFWQFTSRRVRKEKGCRILSNQQKGWPNYLGASP
jgi:hypothetical protein